MAASNNVWENWLERLYNLRRDKSGSHERPHKPALLLSIIDLLDRGVISHVSERSKPASRERMKTSHFEERIAFGAVETAQRRDESTQRELATFDNDLGGAWLVAPADCA